MARDLAPRLVRVRPAGEVVAVVERRHRALEREDLETVRREIELANDLGAQKTDDVREDGELEAGKDLLGHGGAAHQWSSLQDDRLLAASREICRGDESVVPAADDDGVVPAC